MRFIAVMVTEWLIIMKTEWSANEKIHLIIKNQKKTTGKTAMFYNKMK